jgi:Uma2 family endonuclease
MATDLQPRPFAFDAAHRYTIEEYYRLVEEGLLDEDARVELLDGRIVPMSPIGPRHEQVIRQLRRAFERQEQGRYEVDKATPLPIPDHNEPEPDLMLFRIGAATRAHHVRPADVFLVVEVSLSTRDKDLGDKVMIYERGRIPEYWVIDLDKDCLRVFTLEGDHYRRKTFKHGRVSPQAFPDVTVDLDSLLGAED